MKNKIILEAETELRDNESREWISILETRIVTLNDRTKRQTIQIRELEKRIKLMEVKHGRRLQT